MAEIHHRVGIKASAESIYHALTTNEGLSSHDGLCHVEAN